MPRVSPFSRGVITIHEEMWGTTLSLSCRNTNLRVSNKFIVIQFRINPVRFCFATFKQCCQKAGQFTLLLIHDQYHDSFFLGRDKIVMNAYIVLFSFRRGAYQKLGTLTVLNSYNN